MSTTTTADYGGRIGVMNRLTEKGPYFEELVEFGLQTCQLVSWQPELWTEERAAEVKSEITSGGIRVSVFWAGWSGPKVWDFLSGPDTLGIVPIRYRDTRVEEQKRDIRATVEYLGGLLA